MSLKPTSVPTKTLLVSITNSALSFRLNNIKSWKAVSTDLSASDFGTQAYCVFRNAQRTKMEIMEFDPSTVANPSGITILRRGLDFTGDLTTEVAANKLAWTKGDTYVDLGTDTPQLWEWLRVNGVADGIAAAIVAADAKTTPVDADSFGIVDSEASNVLKELTFTNLKAFLKTYFDTLYAAVLGADDNYVTDAEKVVIGNTSGTNTGNETASTVGALINGSSAATPNDTDLVATAESSVLKKITWTNVKAFLKTYFDTIYAAVVHVHAASDITSGTFADARISSSSVTQHEADIEAAIDTLANLTSIQGRTVTLADAGADAIFGWDDSANAYENLTAAEVRTVINVEDGADVTDATNVTAAGALMDSEVTDLVFVKALSDADASTLNTGTSTSAVPTADSLAGSYAGTKSLSVQIYDGTTDVATGDGKAYITIPESLNGMNLVRAQATVVTAGTTNATTVMIHNKTDAADMLSGAISIASAGTVGTVGTINGSADDVATNDVLRIDVDSVSTTAPKGLMVVLEFRLP